MMDVFKKMWPDAWGERMEHILRNVLIALLEQPNATLHDVLRLFADKQFRMQVAKSVRNETVRTFLLKEFEQFSFGDRTDATAPIQNKVGAFLADPLLNRILTVPRRTCSSWAGPARLLRARLGVICVTPKAGGSGRAVGSSVTAIEQRSRPIVLSPSGRA
jgi:hypothetical protein